MLSTFEEDIAELCYKTSTNFSAVRHLSRTDLPQLNTLDTENLLKVNSLIPSQTDSIMSEAKSLLRGWLDEDRVEIKVTDDYEHAKQWESQVFKRKEKLKDEEVIEVARNLLDAIPTVSEKRQASKNLSIALDVRQNLARERRGILEDQKRLRAAQKDKSVKSDSSTAAVQKIKSGLEESIALEIATKELEEERSKRDFVSITKAKEAVLMVKKTTLAIKVKKAEEFEKAQELKRKSIMIETGYTKAEQLYNTHVIRIKRDVFSALLSSLDLAKKLYNVFTLKHSWIFLYSHWKTWKSKSKKRQEAREYDLMVGKIRNEQVQMVSSMRHYRLSTMSKVMLAWKQYIHINRHEQKLIDLHKQREAQMAAFLTKLEQKLDSQAEQVEKSASFEEDLKQSLKLDVNIGNKKSVKKMVPKPRPKKREITKPSLVKAVVDQTSENSSMLDQLKTKFETKSSSVKILKASKNDAKLVNAMAEREKLRLERKELLQLQREKKKRIEQERNLAEQQERERVEAEEREKIVQERRKLEMEAQLILHAKAQEKKRMMAQFSLAKSFHEKAILKNYGLIPLRGFVAKQKGDIKIANDYRNNVVLEVVFKEMLLVLIAKQTRQEAVATTFYSRNILKIFIRAWKEKSKSKQRQFVIADHIHNASLLKLGYKKWRSFFTLASHSRIQVEVMNERKADLFATKCIPRRALNIWKQYVIDSKEAKWKEFRKERLRAIAKDQLAQISTL